MNKALFLDRDGVINKETGVYTESKELFIVNPDIPEALKIASDKGYLLIVITNQGGIAKGIYSRETLNEIHEFLRVELKKNDVELTEIYYCPHHPDTGKCLCRKPDSLMLEKAMARFEIDPSLSFFIGDRERDKQAGDKVGVKTVMIKENSTIKKICEELP